MGTIIEVHGCKFEVESGGFGPQAGAEQARDEAVSLMSELMTTHGDIAPLEIAEAHRCLLADNTDITEWLDRNFCFPAVRETTATWRCWQPGYVGETPWLSLSAGLE